jgi:zinc transport system substrate-binding protein
VRCRPQLLFSLLVCLIILSTGCSSSESEAETARLTITVSILPNVWLVERIGGDTVDVVAIVQPGESPATYQPSDAQVSRVARSDVYFRTGVPFENAPWFDGIRKAGVRTVDLRSGIELRKIESHAHADGAHEADHEHDGDSDDTDAHGMDPHIWLAPALLATQARTVQHTLAELAPDRAELFEANRQKLESELDRLDQDLRATLGAFRGRTFLVFHPAWGYFADAYGLSQRAIEIEGSEPSDRELTEIERAVRELDVRAVFVQPQITGRGAEAVARSIGARLVTLDPLAADVAANLRRVADELAQSYADD